MKLKTIASFIDPKYKESSICESCGDEFTCGATLKGCWCMKVNLTDEVREKLKTKFNDCLCPNCLEKLTSAETSAS